MEAREIVLNTLDGKKTPRLPAALLSGGAWTFNRKGLSLKGALNLGAKTAAEILEESNEEVRSDIVWPGSGYHHLAVGALGGKVLFHETGTPDMDGSLLKAAKDVDKLNPDRLKEDGDIHTLVEMAAILSKSIGRKTLVGTSQWAPFTLAGLIYGEERLLEECGRDKGAVHGILEFATELCLAYLKLFTDSGIEIVSLADPSASGDFLTREQFMAFSLPCLTRVTSKLAETGLPVSIHICGDITPMLDLIPGTGAKNLSLDYKVDLGKAAEILGGKMAFSGNLDPHGVLLTGSPEDAAAASRECIRKAGCSRYILMPGCDIPSGVPLENILSMIGESTADL